MSEAALYDVLFIDRSHNCPTPLPTPNDIDGSEVLPNRPGSARLVRIQQRFIMKLGAHVRPIEAYNMLYVAKATTVPVPKVYAIYQRREKQSTVTYIVMQYVQGTTQHSWTCGVASTKLVKPPSPRLLGHTSTSFGS